MTPQDWVLCIVMASLVLWVEEIKKFILRASGYADRKTQATVQHAHCVPGPHAFIWPPHNRASSQGFYLFRTVEQQRTRKAI